MYQARVKADARWPVVFAGGGQHFVKGQFTPVRAGSEEEIALNPDLELEEVIVALAAEPPASGSAPTATPGTDAPPPAPTVDLEAMTKIELLTRAEQIGVATTNSMTKAQIIAAIQSAGAK